jgi:glutathione S-transferase
MYREAFPEVIKRFTIESTRIYGILNDQLANRDYIAGNQFSIADIAMFRKGFSVHLVIDNIRRDDGANVVDDWRVTVWCHLNPNRPFHRGGPSNAKRPTMLPLRPPTYVPLSRSAHIHTHT